MRERAEALEKLRQKKLQRLEELRKKQEAEASTVEEAPVEEETTVPELPPETDEFGAVINPPDPAPVLVAEEPEEEPVAEEAEPVQEVQEAVATVTTHREKTHYGKVIEESSDEDHIEVAPVNHAPASVRFGYGNTVNLGDYNGAKVYIEITTPCRVEDIDTAAVFAKEKVAALMEVEMSELVN